MEIWDGMMFISSFVEIRQSIQKLSGK